MEVPDTAGLSSRGTPLPPAGVRLRNGCEWHHEQRSCLLTGKLYTRCCTRDILARGEKPADSFDLIKRLLRETLELNKHVNKINIMVANHHRAYSG